MPRNHIYDNTPCYLLFFFRDSIKPNMCHYKSEYLGNPYALTLLDLAF